ncbi:MAG: phosphatase PAP2 family protein [Candidatus Heteroscillospira sp.]|jgi:membrane-associated phospholipid phosphatase
MIQSFDENALLFIQEHLRFEPLTAVMRMFTRLGDAGIIWIILGIALLCFGATRRRGTVYLAALASTAVLNNLVLKPLIARPRPYSVLESLVVLTDKLSSWSFPSGHASASFAAATALTLLFPKKGAWSFIPAAMIALSRPYLGMHYLTDVLCGAALGAACALIAVKAARGTILK